MTPDDYLAEVRADGWTEEKIAKNLYAIQSGRFHGIKEAMRGAAVRATKETLRRTRTDSEKAHSSALRAPYTTAAAKKWLRDVLGHTIVASEYTDRRGHKHDVQGGWDIFSVSPAGENCVTQAICPGSYSAHVTDPKMARAIEQADKVKAKKLMAEFVRIDPVARRMWRHTGGKWVEITKPSQTAKPPR